MNAIAMLKDDHKKVRRLFAQFIAAKGAVARKRQIAEKTCRELEIHTKLEEHDFYPAVASTSEAGADFIRTAEQEHQAVDDLIAQLRRTPPESAEFDSVFAGLRENVENHVGEEEGRLFPYAERALGADNLAQLGQRMTERKRSLNSPGLLGSTLERAKKMVTSAVEAVSETVAEITGNGAASAKHASRGGVRRQKTAPSRATNASSIQAERPRATPSKSTKAKPAARKVRAKRTGKPTAKTKARSTTAPRKAGRRAPARGARALGH